MLYSLVQLQIVLSGEIRRVGTSGAQFVHHPMRMSDDELQGEVWDLMVKAVDKYGLMPGDENFDCAELLKEFEGER